jgi:CheY-like chemotaxis protein
MAEASEGAAQKGVTILVVDDERIVAKDLQRNLEKLGYRVPHTAASAEEAIQRASERAPDLVIMDIRIKGDRDGIDAAGIFHDRFHIPVIYLTAYADDATLSRAKKTEPHAYLLKPVRMDELRSAVELALYKHETERRAFAGAQRGSAPAQHPEARPADQAADLLVVDDDPMVRGVIEGALAGEHRLVWERAPNVLALIEGGRWFDLILCDLLAAGLTGMDLHAELLRRCPDQAGRMVFLTGGAYTTRTIEFLRSVRNPTIEKPFDPAELRGLVNDLLVAKGLAAKE